MPDPIIWRREPADNDPTVVAPGYRLRRTTQDWQQLALHALSDLRLLILQDGQTVDIANIPGVDTQIVAMVDEYDRQNLSYT